MTTTTIDARDIMVTRELKVSTPDLGWLAAGMLAAAAEGEVYGVRQHAHIVAEGLTAIAESTDGYRLHQMHLSLREPVERIEAVIPRDVLVWAKRNVRTFKPKRDSLIEPVASLLLAVPAIQDENSIAGWVSAIYREWDDDTAPSARFDAPLVKDAYPHVERIIDQARAAEPTMPHPIQLAFIADAQNLETTFTDPPVIQFTAGPKGKPGPALLDFWESGNLRATALIQPSSGDGGDE
ncbi:hypothetical protein QWJ90_01440 [Microbacterium oryzae]|uniref:hypothetical protein n=1 Tax=Microbacterium oryzae TaxID=743009 RepID=UPI0025B227E4|nr:hypothetical protein [Microbacterium oryzae]MDN3309586.1 hypothetical protein [Microbacterium oryzae]